MSSLWWDQKYGTHTPGMPIFKCSIDNLGSSKAIMATTWTNMAWSHLWNNTRLQYDQIQDPIHRKSCLLTILVSESTLLIWKLRCECIFKMHCDSSQFHSVDKIRNKWIFNINSRLKFDQMYTNQSVYGKRAIPSKAVLQTWSSTLLREENLLDDWSQQSGVLVGITSRQPPGHNR